MKMVNAAWARAPKVKIGLWWVRYAPGADARAVCVMDNPGPGVVALLGMGRDGLSVWAIHLLEWVKWVGETPEGGAPRYDSPRADDDFDGPRYREEGVPGA